MRKIWIRNFVVGLFVALVMVSSVQITQAAFSGDSSSGVTSAPPQFSDIEDHWAKSTIESFVAAGLISGYPDGTFRPENTMSIAEFSHILARIMQVEADISNYDAIEGHWAQDSMNALIEENVIEPKVFIDYHEGFYPDQSITRLEIARMTSQALAARSYWYKQIMLGYHFMLNDRLKIELPFTDEEQIYYTERQATATAVFAGIVNGLPDGRFNPRGFATRAEAVVMLQRFIDARHTEPELERILSEFEAKDSIQKFILRSNEVAIMIKYVVEEEIKPEDSDLAKLLKITQFIAKYAEQDEDPMPEGWLVYRGEPQTAYGALVDSAAIAEGYADATKVMLDALGFENMIIEVDGAPRYYHSSVWNLVKLSDGKWYHLHNSLNDNSGGNFNLALFLTTDEHMWGNGFRWDRSLYPKSAEEAVLPDLTDPSVRNVVYEDGKIYWLYVDPETRERELYSKELAEDGPATFVTDCRNGGCTTLVLDGEYMYLNKTDAGHVGIFRMRTDGSEVTYLKDAYRVRDLRLTEDGRRLTFTRYESSEHIEDEIILE